MTDNSFLAVLNLQSTSDFEITKYKIMVEPGKVIFSEKTVKNRVGGTFDNFSGKGGVLLQKLI